MRTNVQLLPKRKTLNRGKSLKFTRMFESPNESRSWKKSGLILGIVGGIILTYSVVFLIDITLELL